MFAKSFFQALLIPAVVMALAGAIALAEGGAVSQPDPSTATAPAVVETPESVPATVAPAETPATDEATPAVHPEKKHKIKKVAPVLDPVGEGKMLFETRCGT